MAVPTLTPNSPSAGDIAWTAFHIQYNGTSYAVNAGNTADTYVYWLYNGGSPSSTLSASNTQPALTADDLLLFLNKGGIPTNLQSVQLIDGDLIVDGTITAAQIEAGTITGSLIQAGTITGSLIGANTIVANNIAAGTITSSLIAADAITAGLVAAGAIDGQVINGVTLNGVTVNATSGGMFVYNGSGSTILNANPNFTSGITNWTATLGSISYTTPTISGHDTMELAITNPSGMVSYDGTVLSEFEAVTAGSNYLVTYQVQLFAVAFGAALAVNWYNSGGTLLSQSTIASPTGTISTWTTYSGVVTAPAGATQMKLSVTGTSNQNTAFVNVGQAQIATNPMLINAVAPAAGTDQYGNAYQLGVGSYGPSGGYALLASNGTFPALIMEPESVTHLTLQPQIYGSATNAGAVNEFNEMILSSGKSGHDDAALQLFGESADATIAANAVIEFGGQAVIFVSRSGLAANQPGTSNTPEAWHTITMDSGWTVVSGYAAPQYRMLPDGSVQFTGLVSHASFTSATALNSSNPLPAAYRPATRKPYRTGNGGTIADVEYETTGVINGEGQASGSIRLSLDGVCPLV